MLGPPSVANFRPLGYNGAIIRKGGMPMDLLSYLQEAAAKHGPSGHEGEVAAWLAERFRPLCDRVDVDPLYNVVAVKKATRPGSKPAPRVLLCAHQDEIALMVSDILPDGTLRMGQVGGVDPRILPASTVTVHARARDGEARKLPGWGCRPICWTNGEKAELQAEDLFVIGPARGKGALFIHGDLIT